MCSALYLNVFEVMCLLMRLAADKWTLQTRYPIYFVVKNHRSSFSRKSRALRLLKPAEVQSVSRFRPVSGSMSLIAEWQRAGNSE